MEVAVAQPARSVVAPDDLGVARVMTVTDRWLGAVAPGSGFVAVPMALLRLQTKYGLTATDLVVLINLMAHWWDDRPVYPRTTTIATRMGVDKRTVQRSLQALVKKGLLDRQRLEDGRRIFQFDVLAQRLARDVSVAHSLRAEEVLDA